MKVLGKREPVKPFKKPAMPATEMGAQLKSVDAQTRGAEFTLGKMKENQFRQSFYKDRITTIEAKLGELRTQRGKLTGQTPK